ncbi:hypothetical protein TNCV_5113511 [Trichonephila clavipes]|nr:hypothetical protein TNCV_5113511 [Trichonephila clavipes]
MRNVNTVIPGLWLPRLTRILCYAIFKSRRFVFFFILFTEIQMESVPEPDEIGNETEEVVDLASSDVTCTPATPHLGKRAGF